jgi:predicted TIM-barrel fold metal-dependent hydrolase
MTHESNATRGFEIVDAHTHLAWQDCVPEAFIDATVDNVHESLAARGMRTARTAIRDRLLSEMQDPWGNDLVAQLDAGGVAQAAVMVPDFTFVAPGRVTIEELLLQHRRAAERHAGRLVLFAGVDPRWEKDGIDLFERAVRDWGFRGLKLYPPCGYGPSDRLLFPYYEVCRKYALPVLLHIGPTSPCLSFEHGHPRLLDRACREFPTVKFVLGHGGAHHVEDCVAMAAFRPNVYIDSSGMQVGSSLTGVTRGLDALFAKGIGHKLLYGTDWPVSRTPMASVVASVFDDEQAIPSVSELELKLLASGNFARLWEPAICSSEKLVLDKAALSVSTLRARG